MMETLRISSGDVGISLDFPRDVKDFSRFPPEMLRISSEDAKDLSISSLEILLIFSRDVEDFLQRC